jgi:hypothetical protein
MLMLLFKLSATVTVIVKEPTLGEPLKTPAGLICSPGGGLEVAKTYGANPPEAVKVCE